MGLQRRRVNMAVRVAVVGLFVLFGLGLSTSALHGWPSRVLIVAFVFAFQAARQRRGPPSTEVVDGNPS